MRLDRVATNSSSTADLGDLLGYPEPDERLSRTAGHHELSAIVGFESDQDVSKRRFLVGPQLEGAVLPDQFLGFLTPQVRPVKGMIQKPAGTDHRAMGSESPKGLPGIRPP